MIVLQKILFIIIGILLVSTSAGAADTSFDEALLKSWAQQNDTSLLRLSRQYQEKGMADSALSIYNIILSRSYSGSENDFARASALLESAVIYYDYFNYAKAMELLLKASQLCEDRGYLPQLAKAYRYIGNIYSMHSDFGRAIAFYEKSLTVACNISDRDLEHAALSNLVAACVLGGKPEMAREYFGKLQAMKIDTPRFLYDLTILKGMLEEAEGRRDKAIRQYREAISLALKNSMDVKQLGTPYSSLAGLYLDAGQPDSALFYLKKNEALAREENQQDLLTETVKLMASIYRMQGNSELYQKYFDEYVELYESIFNQQRFNDLKNAQFEFDLDREEKMVKELNDEKIRQEERLGMQARIIWVIALSALILLALLMIIYRQKNRLSGAYSDLFAKNKENLRNEEIYLSRIHDLESRVPAEVPAGRSVPLETPDEPGQDGAPEDEEGEAGETSATLPEGFRKKLNSDILAVMEESDTICDPSFSINRLAELVGSNTTYVSRVINEVYEKNFRTYLNEFRIRESMKRLADRENYGHLTLKAIAEGVGFKSQSTFISAFTKYTGMKPSLYQEMALRQETAR